MKQYGVLLFLMNLAAIYPLDFHFEIQGVKILEGIYFLLYITGYLVKITFLIFKFKSLWIRDIFDILNLHQENIILKFVSYTEQ